MRMWPWSVPLPAGWSESTLWGGLVGVSEGRLAWCARATKQILYFPRWWLAPLWPLLRLWVRGHERGHAWGISARGCLACRPDCLMSEEESGRDSWAGKARLWPRQIPSLGRPCPACSAYISKAIEGAACR